jgi:hypothetical protein
VLLLPTAAFADRSSTNVDFTIGPVFSSGVSSGGSNGPGLDVDDGIGLGFAYHFSNRLAVGFETAFVEPDYELCMNTDEAGMQVIDHEMTITSFQFNGIFHLLGMHLLHMCKVG